MHPEGGDGGGVEAETLVEAGCERGTGMLEAVYVERETRGLGDGEGAWGLGGKGEGGEFGVEGGEEGGVGEDAGEEPGEGGELVERADAVNAAFLGWGVGVREDLRPDEMQIQGAFEGGRDVVVSIYGAPRLDDGADVAEIPPWLFWLFACRDFI